MKNVGENIIKNDTEALAALINGMAATRILVVGDLMLDRFVYGQVERISPESPVPILNITRQDSMLGGSGNVLSNLKGLGADAQILSVIGQDKTGDELCTHIEALGYDGADVLRDPARPTIVKTRYLAGHQQLLRTDSETKAPISDTLVQMLLQKASVLMPNMQAVIISDYGKGVLRPDLIASLIEMANAHDVPILIDPKGTDFSRYSGAALITPNKKELSEATGYKAVSSDQDIIMAATQLIDAHDIQAVIATRSGDGMSLIQKGALPFHRRTTDIEVFDVSGAGDTVIATIAAVIAAGGTLEHATILANIAGTHVVTKVGTAPIRREELEQALHSDQGDDMLKDRQTLQKADRARRADICAPQDAAEQLRRWKARGLKVGFTNGCFDLLHYGHVEYLNAARDHCDRLVLGLNTDRSIQILKGPERPIHNEKARAHLMSALGCIDMVVLFGADEQGDDNTACGLLEILKPDLYFKGGDYTIDQIPEAPTVLAHGGQIKIMPAYEGHSSTDSLEKLKKANKI